MNAPRALSAARIRRIVTIAAVTATLAVVPVATSPAEPSSTPTPTPGVTTTTSPETPQPTQTPSTTTTAPSTTTPSVTLEQRRTPAETSTQVTPSETSPAERRRPGQWEPTENPNATVKPGQMRSDREEIPGGFTKEQADQAETMEAAKLQSRTTSLTAGCQVYWPSPYEVCGAIKDKYNSLGGPNSFLLWPAQPEYRNPDNVGYRQVFQNGPIYWSPAGGAHPVVNHFFSAWQRNGWEGGALMYPTTDEIVLPDGLGRRQEFQGGTIYFNWRANSAYYVAGTIRTKWNQLGPQPAERSFLGYPVSDEIRLPDGVGRMNRFEQGVIYWHPTHGAHPISGAILDEWQTGGYETGRYGYPIADQTAVEGGFRQEFQRDRIYGYSMIIPARELQTWEFHRGYPEDTIMDATPQGTMSASVTYDPSPDPKHPVEIYTMFWEWNLNINLQRIATSPMTCTVDQYEIYPYLRKTGYHDTHPPLPVWYSWHSTVHPHVTNKEYLLAGSCKFSVNENGTPGQANVAVKFQYVILDP